MKFDQLDRKMRVFETAHDHCVLPRIHMVARLDGRGFTRLLRETHGFMAPYDERFRDFMVQTTAHLMDCGFRARFACTHSDEISLLLHRDEQSFGRKLRKLNSILAGEASAAFSLLLGARACFDCRIAQLPTQELVVDYFRWRSEDASRNALSAHCYWALRDEGHGAREATRTLNGLSVADKNELLVRIRGIHFDELPRWHKRGVGIYWQPYAKEIVDSRTGERATAQRRRLVIDDHLPTRAAYEAFIRERLQDPVNL